MYLMKKKGESRKVNDEITKKKYLLKGFDVVEAKHIKDKDGKVTEVKFKILELSPKNKNKVTTDQFNEIKNKLEKQIIVLKHTIEELKIENERLKLDVDLYRNNKNGQEVEKEVVKDKK